MWPYLLRDSETGDNSNRQQIGHSLFSNQNYSIILWNACDYVIQFNSSIAHIPGKNNTAADYLSRLEIGPKEKLILRIREDISTTLIELNVQLAGVTEEDQIFYTDEGKETEEHFWKRKQDARSNPTNQLPDIPLLAVTAFPLFQFKKIIHGKNSKTEKF